MSGATALLAFAVLAALLDVALPVGATPPLARRLLRAAPAGALAAALRSASAPPLPAGALAAFAVADALGLAGEPGVGGWLATLLGQLLLASALWELAAVGVLLRRPWLAGEAAPVLAAGAAILARGRGPRGELAALAPVAVLLLAAAAAATGVQPTGALSVAAALAVALWAGSCGLGWSRGARPAGRPERAARSAAALAFAAPLLPWLR